MVPSEVRRAEEVHALLTATALRGEGVSGVATALAELLDRGVLIEDIYDEPLADAGWKDPISKEHGATVVTALELLRRCGDACPSGPHPPPRLGSVGSSGADRGPARCSRRQTGSSRVSLRGRWPPFIAATW